MRQVIYVDILVGFNAVVTFILLLSVRQFTGIKTTGVRLVLASLAGGAYSLIMLAPKLSFPIAVLTKTLMCISLVCIAFQSRVIRKMIKCCIVFIGMNFLFAGIAYSAENLLHTNAISMKNGFSYVRLSYISLLALFVLIYILLRLMRRKLFSFTGKELIYSAKLCMNGKQIRLRALLDSGHQLKDIYSNRPVFVVNASVLHGLIGFENVSQILQAMEKGAGEIRFRLIPVSTVTASGLLPAFTCEKAVLTDEESEKIVPNLCVVATDDALGGDRYQALIGEDVLKP